MPDPSAAPGERMGVSISVNPRSSKNPRAARTERVSNAQDRGLPRRPEPQVAALHQEVDAVGLAGDRIILDRLQERAGR